MFFHWFRKEYPTFWKNYLDTIKKNTATNRYVVFDCETTGLHIKNDRILSIGAVAVIDDTVVVSEYLELFLEQNHFTPETVPIHGILKEGKEDKIIEAEAIIRFLEFTKNATIVGHHIGFDVEMINQALHRLGLGKLKNKTIDTDVLYQKLKNFAFEEHTSLDELCDVFSITKSDRHTASGDAYITALLFLKLKRKLKI